MRPWIAVRDAYWILLITGAQVSRQSADMQSVVTAAIARPPCGNRMTPGGTMPDDGPSDSPTPGGGRRRDYPA